ncbi:MAG: NAD-dependent epimerase/dehydratase family protein [Pirellulales bacterium]
MHALVTGGGGFLGRYIVEQLVARGDTVRSFGRGAYPELEAIGVEVVRGDITDRNAIVAACEGIDCVFHTAARAGIGGEYTDYSLPNISGTRMVLLGCRFNQVPRLVYTSSPSVVFAGLDQNGIDESAEYAPLWQMVRNAWYSYTKGTAELATLQINLRGGPTRSCALRPHLIWGPRDTHLIPRLIQRARTGKLRRVGNGTNLVDITYVENAAAAHLQAADALADPASPVAGKAYFISQGEPVNCWQWIDQILALVDLPPVRKSISARTAYAIGAVLEGAYRVLGRTDEPRMTRFLARQLSTSHWFDISAARRDFGYQPRVTTAEGMERLGAWLRA